MNQQVYEIYKRHSSAVHTIEASEFCDRADALETAKRVMKHARDTITKLFLKPRVLKLENGRLCVTTTVVCMPVGELHAMLDAIWEEARRGTD